MKAPNVQRAVAAATSIAAELDLTVDEAIVLHNSNRLVLRLLPCDVVARVGGTMVYQANPEMEVEVARRLAGTEGPVGPLEARVEPRVHARDGFVVTFWAYYQPVPSRELRPAEYARALERLHAAMRPIDVATPHFTDRIADTQRWVANRDVTPDLADEDREMLVNTLGNLRRSIVERGAAEQLLHGEPHPWNVLSTRNGPLFMDLENAARGPVEYDLAWVPEDVSQRYTHADQQLVGECRGLMLAIVAAHRWRRDDQHPSQSARAEWLSAVRQGPPWPAVDAV
jgi:hypothetical protein